MLAGVPKPNWSAPFFLALAGRGVRFQLSWILNFKFWSNLAHLKDKVQITRSRQGVYFGDFTYVDFTPTCANFAASGLLENHPNKTSRPLTFRGSVVPHIEHELGRMNFSFADELGKTIFETEESIVTKLYWQNPTDKANNYQTIWN